MEILSLNKVGLCSLNNFPKLPKLKKVKFFYIKIVNIFKKLSLSDNKISVGLDNLVNAGFYYFNIKLKKYYI